MPSVGLPDLIWVTLEIAKEGLCHLFLREFETVVKEGDRVKVTRYLKLFPLLGRGDTGLDAYGRYYCQDVVRAARARLRNALTTAAQKEAAGFFYANALAKLFEHIAQIVEGQYYGAGKMGKVIQRLQMEADTQGGIILDSWNDNKGVERCVTDVKTYLSSLFVQSFLPPQKSGRPRMNNPAMGQGANNVRNSEDEDVNLKEADGLLKRLLLYLASGHLIYGL